MTDTINIVFNKITIKAELNNTKTAKKILKALPVKGDANTWGNEVYFSIPIDAGLENGIEIVELGTLAYWPPGRAFCIFFGPTPASKGPEPQAASPVTVIGKISDPNDLRSFKKVRNGDMVKLETVK